MPEKLPLLNERRKKLIGMGILMGGGWLSLEFGRYPIVEALKIGMGIPGVGEAGGYLLASLVGLMMVYLWLVPGLGFLHEAITDFLFAHIKLFTEVWGFCAAGVLIASAFALGLF